MRTKLKNYVTGNTVERTFRGGESVATAQVEKTYGQFTYMDGDDVSPLTSRHTSCSTDTAVQMRATILASSAADGTLSCQKCHWHLRTVGTSWKVLSIR